MPDEILISIESIGDDSPIPVEVGVNLLSPAEKARANAFRFPKHQNRYVRGRALLRQKLSRLISVPADKIEIKEEERGKPFLKDEALSFNLSHSGDLAIYGFSTSHRQIGIDLELFDRELDVDGLSKHYFSALECLELNQFPGSEKKEMFLKIWTAKEARMKLTGEGLHLDPRSIELTFRNGVPSGFRRPTPSTQHLLVSHHENLGAVSSIVADDPFSVSSLD